MGKSAQRNRPTLIDVAERAGVSRATASLVVRNSPRVSKKTRLNVEAAIAEIGYVYNAGAAGMRAARSRTIGVIIPNLSNPFFGLLLAGIEAVIDKAGLATFIAHSDETPPKQDAIVMRMREHDVDGIIVCPATGTPSDFVPRLLSWDIPVVQVLRHVPGAESDIAGIDPQEGMEAAVDRLVELGHREIGFAAANLQHSAHTDRRHAFRSALARHALEPVVEMEIVSSFAAAAEFAQSMRPGPGTPTAWICHNDVIGLGMHRGFCDAGLVPGREVSLVGFDNVAETELVRPGLASVATLAHEIGATAARLLLRRIDVPTGGFETVLTSTFFVDRGSVGPAPRRA
jgi:LacI family transcriptional regulator